MTKSKAAEPPFFVDANRLIDEQSHLANDSKNQPQMKEASHLWLTS